MKLSMISLDLLVALPLLFLAVTSLFGYAYAVQEHLQVSSSQLYGMLSLYLASSKVYGLASAGTLFNASDFPMGIGTNQTAYLYDFNASPPGCAIRYACRAVAMSGRNYVLVLR